jgi:hypothetical protein
MRPLPHLLILVSLWAGPAAAQESGAPAAGVPAPSASAQQAIWCGAAFEVLAQRAPDDAAAKALTDKASAAFGKAAAELIAEGMTVDQFKVLAQDAATAVTAPFRDTSYTQAECDAVAAPVAPAQ